MSAQILNLESDKEFLRKEIQINQRKYLSHVEKMRQTFSEELEIMEKKIGDDSKSSARDLMD